MQRKTIAVGSFEVNCTILFENGNAWIVDPGSESERLIGELESMRLEPLGILLTHAHFDHIGGVPGLVRRHPELKVYLGKNDFQVVTHPFNQYPPDYPPVRIDGLCDAHSISEILGHQVKAIDTPGHTPGGVSYLVEGNGDGEETILFSGDTLFAGSAGRTDLPGGDPTLLQDSLERLAALPDALVIPGHGPTTTIAAERRTNPFFG